MTNDVKLLCDALRNGHPSRSMCQEAASKIEQLLHRLRFCEDCLRSGVPDEYFGWAGDEPSPSELTQSDAEPVAWQLVPKEPTAEMCDAGREFFPDSMNKNDVYARPVWQAMLAVAPPAPPHPDASAADYDHAWEAIAASDELAAVRRKLSIHELRLLIRAALFRERSRKR